MKRRGFLAALLGIPALFDDAVFAEMAKEIEPPTV
jgi:hypothetical protein